MNRALDALAYLPYGGDTYEPELDGSRLGAQLAAVRSLMSDGRWRTLREISEATGASEASASARLRDLRKRKFGAREVLRRRVGDPKAGLFEYRVVPEDEP